MASESTTENSGVSAEAPAGWGQLEKCESYGKPFDKPEDFAEVDFQESLTRLADHRHAAHAMFYMFDDGVLWDLSAKKGSVLVCILYPQSSHYLVGVQIIKNDLRPCDPGESL